MLLKLMKHNLKFMIKPLAIIYIIILISCFFSKILLQIDSSSFLYNSITSIVELVFATSLIVAFVLSFVIGIKRYYDGVLKNEGYLTNTLPVKKSSIVLAYLFSSFLIQVLTALVVLLVAFIMDPSLIVSLSTVFNEIFSNLTYIGYFLLIIGIIIFAGLASILSFFCALALGHKHDNRKLLYSFLYGLLIYIINQIGGLIYVFTIIGGDESLGGTELSAFEGLPLTILGPLLLLYIVYAVACYFITEITLRKKLNLE